MKKILSTLLAFAMLLGAVVLPVGKVSAAGAPSFTVEVKENEDPCIGQRQHVFVTDATTGWSYPDDGTYFAWTVTSDADVYYNKGGTYDETTEDIGGWFGCGKFVGYTGPITANLKIGSDTPGTKTVIMNFFEFDSTDPNPAVNGIDGPEWETPLSSITFDVTFSDHDVEDWEETVVPGCTTVGEEAGTCTICDGTVTRDIDAIGHDFGAWDETTAPTCTEAGEETGTCQNPGCTEEDTRPVDALGHDWGAWIVVIPATDNTAGAEARICSRCMAIDVNILPALKPTPEPAAKIVNRKDYVLALYKLVGSPKVKPKKVFKDVGTTSEHAKAIYWAYSKGIVKGIKGGNFLPSNAVTANASKLIAERYKKAYKSKTSVPNLITKITAKAKKL